MVWQAGSSNSRQQPSWGLTPSRLQASLFVMPLVLRVGLLSSMHCFSHSLNYANANQGTDSMPHTLNHAITY